MLGTFYYSSNANWFICHDLSLAGGGNEALSSDGSNSSRKENVPPGVRGGGGGGGGGLMICIDMNNTGNDSSEAEAAMGHRDMGSRSSSSPQVKLKNVILLIQNTLPPLESNWAISFVSKNNFTSYWSVL